LAIAIAFVAGCGGGGQKKVEPTTPPAPQQDWEKASGPELEEGCAAGAGGACHELGIRVMEGEGDEENFEQNAAIAHGQFLKGCQLGHARSCTAAAQGKATGVGAEMDLPGAFALILKGCELGDSRACFLVASEYESGYSTEQDSAKAKEYYQKVCDMKDAPEREESCARLANLGG
jgi:TPR repeat protein